MKFHKIFIIIIILMSISYQSIATQLIDTVGTYLELKLYSGTEDTVYVDHQRYYGLFTKDSCLLENYGTEFIGIQSCWKRIFNNYSPRFWAIGGQSPDNFIGNVKKEIDAINSAAFIAFSVGGDTIEIDSMYTIDRSVFLLNNNTYLGTCDSCGFVREEPPVTILTDTAKVDDTKIKVENNFGFRTRQKINIFNGESFDSIAGHASYTASVSLALGGDTTIWLSGLNIQKEMLPGDSVSLFFPMMQLRNSNLDSVYIKNLVFDGNAEQYNFNHDWRVNSTILLSTTNESIIEDCRFYRIPNENVILCGATFKNCSGTYLNGSICHFSCNSFDHPTEVLYNDFSNSNIIGNAIMGHSEAGLTFSAKVQNLIVSYNRFDVVNEYGVGLFQNDDSSNVITDNLINSALETIKFQNLYLHEETNVLYNNKNLNFADSSTTSCWKNIPNVLGSYPCEGNSSWGQPLEIGDTISLSIDSLLLRKSNENFVKYIIPIYDEEYFTLANMEINSPMLSPFHSWLFDEVSPTESGLVFNNGHRNGISGEGNWGYEGCSQIGKCTNIKFYYTVKELPDSTGMVACPFQGFKIVYDGEMGTWNHPIYCENESLLFDSSFLGQPILQGDMSNSLVNKRPVAYIDIYPNPSQKNIYFKDAVGVGYHYQIIDMTNRINQSGELIDNEIFIGHLSDGFYYIKIYKADKSYISKFVKLN